MRTGSKRTCTRVVAHHTTAIDRTVPTMHRPASDEHVSRRFFGLLLALITLLGVQLAPAQAQVAQDSCITHPWVNSLPIRTGWNYVTHSLEPFGNMNYSWTVTADPDPNTAEPRPAWVINHSTPWAPPLPNSRWISSVPSIINGLNGDYTYQFCFCLADQVTNPVLVLRILADDSARVLVNGIPVATTGIGFATPTTVTITNPALFRPGRNCIQIVAVNVGWGYAGLDVSGTLTTGGNQIRRQYCCDPNNVISGTKFNDLNCNGIRDVGEAGLGGWTIQLSNGQTAVTDGNGNYYITGVPPGTYTVTEVLQPGWTQTFPAGGGGYTVTVGRNQVVTGRNFGNCPQVKCFDITNAIIRCAFLPNGVPAYQYTFTLQNQSTFTAKYLTFSLLNPTSGITVQPNPLNMGSVAPGGSTTQNIFLTGPNTIPGTTVKLIVRMCNDTVMFPKVCCLDTIEFTLPYCDCFRIIEQRIDCKWVNGQKQFTWCFRLQNLSTIPMTWMTVVAPAGVTPSVFNFTFPLLNPGQISGWYCVTFNSTPSTAGTTLNFVIQLCNQQKTYCCKEVVPVVLPDCPIICCDKFTKRPHHLAVSASWTGHTNLSGLLDAWNNINDPIIAASMTIVSATVNGQPVSSYFTSGSGLPGIGPGQIPPPSVWYPFSHDIGWGPTTPGTVLNNTPFNVQMKFPAVQGWFDVLRFCIRFRFTDKNCVTCDTVICFQRTRFKFIFFPGPHATGPISATIKDPGTGRLDITFPEMPDGSGIRFVGLATKAVDEGVKIVAAQSDDGRDMYVDDDGLAWTYFDEGPGSSMGFDFIYSDIEGRPSVTHKIYLRYLLEHDEGSADDSTGQDTVELEVGYVFRRPSAEGGDILGETRTDVANVRTYALHLTNGNGSSENIAQLVLGTPDGVRVLAVGPTESPSRATLNFGSSTNGTFVSEELGGARIVLGPGESVRPIYITLAGIEDGASVTLQFTTMNEFGQPITNGEVTLSAPITGAQTSGAGNTEGIQQATTGEVTMRSIPNPSSTSATIDLTLPRTLEDVTLVVTDAKGNEVARLVNGGFLAAGEHALLLNTSDLPSGTYYYTLRANGVQETRSMQVVR